VNFSRGFICLLPLVCLPLTFAQPVTLNAVEQTLEVNGKKATVFNLVQPDGTEGFVGYKGDDFDVTLVNKTSVPISVHWHGMILPNDQDGVPYVTQLPIKPGDSHHYHYKLLQDGTYWMHSHFKFHEQRLMTAPMILKDHNDKYKNDKDIVVMFQDFTFKNPEQILFDLQHKPHSSMAMNMDNKKAKPDLNDVQYDAFLANRHTLKHPVIYHIKADEKIRLRLINGSSASNYWINTGSLKGTAIALDGNFIQPFTGYKFQLAVAQRIDIEVTIPKNGGTFPILAQVEGTNNQAGVILTTEASPNIHVDAKASEVATALNDEQEMHSHAVHPLSKKKPTAVLNYKLTGDMANYIWKINDQVWPKIKPLTIKKGDRVEMVFTNDTGMAHPMHLHGHIFQVESINGNQLANGPLRDTILVLPHSTKKIIFDAENPGIWMLHCHVLYHMNAGMMTTTNYIGYPEPSFYKDLIAGKIKE
jgi:FtsP/CotA-like multicopper oxidase with cupredoxin domain